MKPESKFLKCDCIQCGGSIEFPEHGIGEEVTCPHCRRRTKLSTSASLADRFLNLLPEFKHSDCDYTEPKGQPGQPSPPKQPPAPEPRKIVPCKSCGKTVALTAQTCPHCGQDLPSRNFVCGKCGSHHVGEKTHFSGCAAFAAAAFFGLLAALAAGPLGFLLAAACVIVAFCFNKSSQLTCLKCDSTFINTAPPEPYSK